MKTMYEKHPEVEDVEIQGCWIIWQPKTKMIVKLQGIPGRVWKQIRRKKDHREMVLQIGRDHQLQIDRAELAVASAIRELLQIGILKKVPLQDLGVTNSGNARHGQKQ